MRFNAPAAGVRGFTLIEALIVMVVLAIVAAVGISNCSRYVTRGQLVEATNSLGEYRLRISSTRMTVPIRTCAVHAVPLCRPT